jgi:hypothetical protein
VQSAVSKKFQLFRVTSGRISGCTSQQNMPPTIQPQPNEKQEKELKSHHPVKGVRAGIHYVGKATTFLGEPVSKLPVH